MMENEGDAIQLEMIFEVICIGSVRGPDFFRARRIQQVAAGCVVCWSA